MSKYNFTGIIREYLIKRTQAGLNSGKDRDQIQIDNAKKLIEKVILPLEEKHHIPPYIIMRQVSHGAKLAGDYFWRQNSPNDRKKSDKKVLDYNTFLAEYKAGRATHKPSHERKSNFRESL